MKVHLNIYALLWNGKKESPGVGMHFWKNLNLQFFFLINNNCVIIVAKMIMSKFIYLLLHNTVVFLLLDKFV